MFGFFTRKSIRDSKPLRSIKSDSIANLALYYFPSCPYCRMVLKQINRQSLGIELRDIHHDITFKKELIACGGKKTVPCLKIDKVDGSCYWLYESMDILAFLKETY